MERIAVLREQAAILRALANSFNDLTIREQLLDLAARCDETAKSWDANPQAAGLKPSASPLDPRRVQ